MYEKITYYSRISQTLHVPVPAAPTGIQSPDQIFGSNLIAWYKADDNFSLGSEQTLDFSGNGNTIVVSFAGSITYNSTTMNGYPGYLFVGNGGFITNNTSGNNTPAATAAFGTGSGGAAFAVMQMKDTTDANADLLGYTATGETADWNNDNSMQFLGRSSSDPIWYSYRNGTQSGNQNISYDTIYRLCSMWDSGTATTYIDNASPQSASGVAKNWATPGYLTIGQPYAPSAANALWGAVGEVVFVNVAPTSTQRTQMDDYLKNRYGL